MRTATLGAVLVFIVAFLVRPPMADAATPSPTSSSPEESITEISYVSYPCNGPCLVYRVSFYDHGCAKYDGIANVPLLGHFEGFFLPPAFTHLARFIEDREFFTMPTQVGFNPKFAHENYRASLTVVRNGRRTTVTAYNDAITSETARFHEIETTIAGMIFRGYWQCPWTHKGTTSPR
jgi:hypothetical protein